MSGYLGMIVGGVFLALWIAHLVLRSRFSTRATVSHSGFKESPSEVYIAYFPGIAWDPRMQLDNVAWLFRKRGTMNYVYYSGDKGSKARWFSSSKVVQAAARDIHAWKQRHPNGIVVLVGASMGADLAHRTDMLLGKVGISTKAVLIDPPRGWKDLALLQRILVILGWAVYNLPVLHLLLFLQPAIKFLVPMPKRSQIEKRMQEPHRLKRLHQAVVTARRTKVSFYVGESLSLLSRMPKGKSSWTGYDVAVIHSQYDDTVKASAYQSWERRIGQQLPCFMAQGAYHVGFGLTPSAYDAPVKQALKWILDRK